MRSKFSIHTYNTDRIHCCPLLHEQDREVHRFLSGMILCHGQRAETDQLVGSSSWLDPILWCSNTRGEFQHVARLQQRNRYGNARPLVGVAWVWPYVGLWWAGCWGRRPARSTVQPRREREGGRKGRKERERVRVREKNERTALLQG